MKLTAEFEIPDDIFGQIVTKEYLEKRLKELIFNVLPIKPSPIKEIPKLPKCKAGPEIKKINIIGTDKLSVLFHGDGVELIEYTIYKNIEEIEKGEIIPKNNTPIINLKNKLSSGIYTLKFKGVLCDGESTKTFEI